MTWPPGSAGTAGTAVRLDVPPGDPQAVADLVARMRAARVAVADARDAFAGLPHAWEQSWQGIAASSAQESVHGLGLVVGTALNPLDVAAAALDRWRQALSDAQIEIRRLQRLAEDLATDARIRRSSLVIQLEHAEAAAASSLPTQPNPLLPRPADAARTRIQSHDAAAALQQSDVRRQADAVRSNLDAVALEVRRTLEQTRPIIYRGSSESLSDWQQRAISDVVAEIPGLDEHLETVRAGVWAFMTVPQFAGVGTQVVRRSVNLYTAIQAARAGSSAEIAASRLPWGLRFLAGRIPQLGSLLAPETALYRALVGTAPTQNLWTVGRTAAAAGSGGLRGAASTVGALARGAGVLRGLGIVGSVAATGVSAANVISQGNPVDAFRANGAGYVADVAELGFNVSTTAFLIAPNPVTAGAMVVTGVVWAGAELVDHWDDVTQLASDGVDAVADAADAVADTVADGVASAGEAVGNAAREVGGWLNPFD